MPLLRKQPFARKKPPSDIRLDEEVFWCETTNEIFRDYEEFFNRVIECNSLVWTCGITGKPGLTYQEALESEERARKHLESFPTYLRRVVLYLASRTRRTRLSDMNDDVFVYVKDRFFKGEIVDAVVEKQEKVVGVKVIKITPPLKKNAPELIVLDSDDSDDEPLAMKSPSKAEDVDPAKYDYVVQVPDGKSYTVKGSAISRKKGIFTRDKCKLFLKQNCEADEGLWIVKSKIAEKYKLSEIAFINYFSSLPPLFPDSFSSKKKSTPKKQAEAIKKAKKEMKEQKERLKIEKEKQKKIMEEAAARKKLTPEEREAIKEQLRLEKEARKKAMMEERMAKKEEIMQRQREEREKRKLELQEERKKLFEEKKAKDDIMKEWSKQRDDMDCDDLKPLPKPTPVRTTLPPSLFGEAVMLLEFTKHFDAVLDMDDHFPDGFDFKTLEQALVDPDTNGPLTDLCEALLSTIISLQEEEDAEEGELNLSDEDTSMTADDSTSNKTLTQLIQDATIASKWSQIHQGMPLKKLTFDSMTLTEILRLHFQSSGARGSARSIKFRYQQRGGYSSLDDAGLEFKITEPELFKALCTTSVFDMSPAAKLKILTGLSNQILTYAASRDLIDDVIEKVKQAKMDLKHFHWAENQREREEASARWKKRQEERAKEKAREEERKAQRRKEMEERLKAEGGDEKVNGDVEMKDGERAEPKKPKKDADPATPEPTVKTRHRAAEEDELKALIEEGADDIDITKLTPEEYKLLRQKRAEKDAKKKAEFHEKEQEYIQQILELQGGFNIVPLGHDRAHRRFWVFDSIPGVFVEVDEQHLTDDSLFEPIEQVKSTKGEDEKADDKSTASDKENESFDGTGNKVQAGNTKSDNPLSTAKNINGNISVDEGAQNMEEKMDTDEKIDTSLYDSIVPDRNIVWSYYASPQELEQLIDSLNPRGFRECSLKQALIEQKEYIQKSFDNDSIEFLQASSEAVEESDKNVAQIASIKSRNREVKGKVKNASAQEFMELNLREMLLDFEGRTHAGSLGTLKVKNRAQWREAMENGSYSAQCDELTWSGQREEVKEMNADDETSESEEEETSQLVKDLARALLQIEQGIEPKFLNVPLGESEAQKKARQKTLTKSDRKDDKKSSKKSKDEVDEDVQEEKETSRHVKTVLERWEESLMKSTSLSQIFLHLSTLDTSVIWSKSVLNARCKICKRQSYADQMLLCDSCDRGHHMFCLKPPVKKIPQGEWFCPECRPKISKKVSPRKNRKSFADNSDASSDDEEEDSDSEEEEEADDDEEEEENEDSSEEEEEEEDSDEDEEEDSDEEEKEDSPKPTKISMKGMKKKPQPKSGRSTPTSVRSGSRAKNSPVDGRGSRASSRAGKRVSMEPSSSRPSSRAGKRASVEPSTSRPSSRAGKRSHDSDEEDLKLTTKSRGSETSNSMKLMEKLVYEVVDHEDSWLFLKPVTKRDAPDYFDIVKKPMDLSTIRANINAFRYNGPADIAEDMRQMFKNCEIYNLPSAEEYKLGTKLAKLFEKRFKELKIDLGSSAKDGGAAAKEKEVVSKRPRRK